MKHAKPTRSKKRAAAIAVALGSTGALPIIAAQGANAADDLNCADIGHQVKIVNGDDPNGLDRDHDGIGCESYPGPATPLEGGSTTTAVAPKVATTPSDAPDDYIVKRGDNMSAIAARFGVKLADLEALNPGVIAGDRPDDYSLIFAGGHIHLPVGAVPVKHAAPVKVRTWYANCDVAPAGLHVGQPGYRHALDMDGDGKACEGPWPPASTTTPPSTGTTTPPPASTGTGKESAAADAAIAYAKTKLGDPYVWGATGPDGFDCSGLIYASYVYGARQPSSFPRDTLAEYDALPHISDGSTIPDDILPGDLILMYFDGTSQPDYVANHVTMYIGNGQQIEASGSHGGVAITNVAGRGGRVVAVVRPTPADSTGGNTGGSNTGGSTTPPPSDGTITPAIAPDDPGNSSYGINGNYAGGPGSNYSAHDPSFWAPIIDQAKQLVGVDYSDSDIEGLMATESGGDPNVVNDYDSNWSAGTPSKGLMQVIDPTFQTYHVDGTSDNIFDPLANIAAALAYIKDNYGSVPGSPY